MELELKIWEIYDGETHWYAAESSKHALNLHARQWGTDLENEDVEITMMDHEQLLSVEDRDNDDQLITKTAFEWTLDGSGLVSSTAI